jgi:uncharacterized protein (TIGR02217 family)
MSRVSGSGIATGVSVAFLEVQFPTTISYKAIGGPGFNTTVNAGLSGQEQRNRNWSRARGKWTVSLTTPTGVVRQDYVDLLYAFFLNVGGKADAFRLKDHKDFKATNQPLVTYNGVTQLARTRTVAGRDYVQIITKPITSGVTDYQGNLLADTVFLAGTNTPVVVDPTTGAVSGQAVGTLVDFQYHLPVRFDTDELQMQIEESNTRDGQPIVSLNSVGLIEVLPPNY